MRYRAIAFISMLSTTDFVPKRIEIEVDLDLSFKFAHDFVKQIGLKTQ
jgi:hypothetical protein